MSREEMIEYCWTTTNAERRRRSFAKIVPREFYEQMSDAALRSFTEMLKSNPRDADGNLIAVLKWAGAAMCATAAAMALVAYVRNLLLGCWPLAVLMALAVFVNVGCILVNLDVAQFPRRR